MQNVKSSDSFKEISFTIYKDKVKINFSWLYFPLLNYAILCIN